MGNVLSTKEVKQMKLTAEQLKTWKRDGTLVV